MQFRGPVFLHSNWRSSSTYVWAKFRSLPDATCYFEPLNEQLAMATQRDVDAFVPWAFANHPDLDHPYFEEYRPLLAEGGGVPGFPADLVYGRYRLGGGDEVPCLAAYFHQLDQFARDRGSVPVFGLVRSSLRLPWFRRHLPGVHIFIRRHPRCQFVSALRQAVKGNGYFLERPWRIFAANRCDPAFAPLRAIFGEAMDCPADPTELYLIFHFLHRLAMRDVATNCDLVLDVDALSGDGAAIAEAERRVAALTGFALSFADCRPEPYSDNLDWSAEGFAGLESLAEGLLDTPLAEPERVAQLAERFHRANLPGIADRLYHLALEFPPGPTAARFGLAVLRREHTRFGEAERLLGQMLADHPDHLAALLEHGRVLVTLKRFGDAVAPYRRALVLAPDQADAHKGLAAALIGLEEWADALTHLLAAAELTPDCADTQNGLGRVLMELERPDEALSRFDAALVLAPDLADALNYRGNALIELGRIAEAKPSIERAIRLAPRRPAYYRRLAEITRFTADDPHLAAMRALAADMDGLAIPDRMELHFALAKALEDCGEPGEAFDHLIRGNGIKRQQTVYDEAAALAEFERIRAVFTAERLNRRDGVGAPSERPIFIVGMPRSGSTLVEQIFAGHPDVHAAGELEQFGRALGEIGWTDATGEAAALGRLGARYLDATAALAPAGARRITDKMLGNFRHAGLIALALPGARIIHTRRNPLDTCVSCFTALFAGHQPFTYDLGELGRYYRGYQRLMAHWRQVLPEGVMIEVDYEQVVADLPGQAQRLLAFCGLPWDPACLEFYRNPRPVRTRSRAQVRQPLYGHAVGRWQIYGERLEPLRAALSGG